MVCLWSTSSTLLTTSRKSGFSLNLVSLFVCTFVAILAVRTTVGGAVWAGPEEKQALESYILIFVTTCGGGKRFCLNSWNRHSRAVNFGHRGADVWYWLHQYRDLEHSVDLVPRDSSLALAGMEGLWISQFSPASAFSNCTISPWNTHLEWFAVEFD